MTITETETTAWDAADYVDGPDDEMAYLEAAFEDVAPAVQLNLLAFIDHLRWHHVPVSSRPEAIRQALVVLHKMTDI